MESLDMLANNLANAGTTGFKADREFYDLYTGNEASLAGTSSELPLIDKPWIDFSQGTIVATSNPLDVAISGSGFLTAKGPNGLLFTRNGSLKLSTAGELQTKDGYPVLSTLNKSIKLDPSHAFDITAEGLLRQDGADVASLRIVDFDQSGALKKRSSTYFQLDDQSVLPRAAKGSEVKQGHLESTNSGGPEAAVRLVSIMRQFEMLQRAITLGGEMNRRSLEEVARVS
jgi:flagellar basal-body rod protein FlgF